MSNVERYFHIRTLDRNGGATVRVVGNPNNIGTVDVQAAFCSKKDNYCRETGRLHAVAAPIKTVPLRDLGRELFNIEQNAWKLNDNWFKKHPDQAKVPCRDWGFAIRYFLPKV
jgi:hypothetical protein